MHLILRSYSKVKHLHKQNRYIAANSSRFSIWWENHRINTLQIAGEATGRDQCCHLLSSPMWEVTIVTFEDFPSFFALVPSYSKNYKKQSDFSCQEVQPSWLITICRPESRHLYSCRSSLIPITGVRGAGFPRSGKTALDFALPQAERSEAERYESCKKQRWLRDTVWEAAVNTFGIPPNQYCTYILYDYESLHFFVWCLLVFACHLQLSENV